MPQKTNMTTERQPFEDVSQIKNCDFTKVILDFSGGGGTSAKMIRYVY